MLEANSRHDLDEYLRDLEKNPVRNLEELIRFNTEHSDEELPPGKHSPKRVLNTIATSQDMPTKRSWSQQHNWRSPPKSTKRI